MTGVAENQLLDRVLLKVGKNVLFYQQFELMLKYITAHGNFSGFADELEQDLTAYRKRVMKQTLGQVTDSFLNTTFNDHKYLPPSDQEVEKKGIHFSFSFNIPIDEELFNHTKEQLAVIVAERNILVHELPLKFDLNSDAGLLELEKYLDDQRNTLRPQYNNLKAYVDGFQETKKKVVEYLSSEKMLEDMQLSGLRSEVVIKILADISLSVCREDGWTLLNYAGELLHQNVPNRYADCKKLYGHNSLKKLIQATKTFDLKEEETAKGGKRVLYRLREGWSIENGEAVKMLS